MFSCVCPSISHSVERWDDGPMWLLPVMHCTSLYRTQPAPAFSYQTWDLTVQGPSWTWNLTLQGSPGPTLSPGHGTSLYTDSLSLYWRHLVAISGDLFKLVHYRIPSPTVLTSAGYWSTYSWDKREICFLLECFLVVQVNMLWPLWLPPKVH